MENAGIENAVLMKISNFIQQALNWSKVSVKAFTKLQNIFIQKLIVWIIQ